MTRPLPDPRLSKREADALIDVVDLIREYRVPVLGDDRDFLRSAVDKLLGSLSRRPT